MTYKYEPRRSPTVWLVVADRAAARIFEATWPALDDAREIESLIHAEGAAHGRDVYTDSFGRDRAPSGGGFTNIPSTDFRHQTADAFAQRVLGRLEAGRTENRFGRLIVVAPPLFLGALRKHAPAALRKLVEFEVDKELVQAGEPEILEQVRGAIAAAT